MALNQFTSINNTTRALADHLAHRKRNREVLNIPHIARILNRPLQETVDAFSILEKEDTGRIEKDRKGKPALFRFREPIKAILEMMNGLAYVDVQNANGGPVNVGNGHMANASNGRSASISVKQGMFIIRKGNVTVKADTSATEEEIKRLADIIKLFA